MFEVRYRLLSCREFCRRHIITIVVVMCISLVVPVAMFFRYHLWWMYRSHSREFEKFAALPVAPLPASPVPANWVRCQFSGFELSLPPGFATNGNDVSEHEITIFTSGTKTVLLGRRHRQPVN